MLNRIVKSVVQAMSGTLTSEQLQKLQNVLYINFQGTKVTKDETEIVPLDSNNDTQKLKLFRMSKLVSGRQESTLKQYIREIVKCRNVINNTTLLFCVNVIRFLCEHFKAEEDTLIVFGNF